MEAVLAHVRSATTMPTYDFVDVVKHEDRCGWQVKSTKAGTPVTWKRAKIPNATSLIKASKKSAAGLQQLGNAIIEFCNAHAHESLSKYDLDEIGYSRLIIHKDGHVTYFERLLCTRESPRLFNPHDFKWKWSHPKHTIKKEQLPALHGTHKPTGEKWWAWHGLGENQLHFSGEAAWWPQPRSHHVVTFKLPTGDEKISFEMFAELLSHLDLPT